MRGCGYVYDSETDLYYLQSRYYDPGMGRFLNADVYTSTGQGVLGSNMFAYCGNNPVMRADYGGCSWSEFWEAFFEAFRVATKNATGTYSAGLAVSQVDGITPGPADIAAICVIGIAFFGSVIISLGDAIAASSHSRTIGKTKAQSIVVPRTAKKKLPQYWEAQRVNNQVVLGRGLTIAEASARVASGKDVMCPSQGAAKLLLVLNGYGNAVGPEKHGGEGYYWHYHPNRHTHIHIWYYGEG